MTLEQALLIICSLVILVLVILTILMYVRIRQLMREVSSMQSRLEVTDAEIDALVQNVEEIRKLKI